MNKTQLIDAVAKSTGIKKREVETVIDNFIDKIVCEVAEGEKVQITGFGSFERKCRGERNIKNPRTGEDMLVPPSKSPSFSAGSTFKDKVNKQ
jgi:DNA-binding protein HU-beta